MNQNTNLNCLARAGCFCELQRRTRHVLTLSVYANTARGIRDSMNRWSFTKDPHLRQHQSEKQKNCGVNTNVFCKDTAGKQ